MLIHTKGPKKAVLKLQPPGLQEYPTHLNSIMVKNGN